MIAESGEEESEEFESQEALWMKSMWKVAEKIGERVIEADRQAKLGRTRLTKRVSCSLIIYAIHEARLIKYIGRTLIQLTTLFFSIMKLVCIHP